jgi:hypothetical protein
VTRRQRAVPDHRLLTAKVRQASRPESGPGGASDRFLAESNRVKSFWRRALSAASSAPACRSPRSSSGVGGRTGGARCGASFGPAGVWVAGACFPCLSFLPGRALSWCWSCSRFSICCRLLTLGKWKAGRLVAPAIYLGLADFAKPRTTPSVRQPRLSIELMLAITNEAPPQTDEMYQQSRASRLK